MYYKSYNHSLAIMHELQQLVDTSHIELLGSNLRRLFIDFLMYELKTGVPLYFDDFLYPVNCLFDFLDVLAAEVKNIETKDLATPAGIPPHLDPALQFISQPLPLKKYYSCLLHHLQAKKSIMLSCSSLCPMPHRLHFQPMKRSLPLAVSGIPTCRLPSTSLHTWPRR